MMAFLGKDRCGFFVLGLLRDTQNQSMIWKRTKRVTAEAVTKISFALLRQIVVCCLLSGQFGLKGVLSMHDV